MTLTRITTTLLLAASVAVAGLAQSVSLPNRRESVKFVAIGDNGTGGTEQYEVAEQMAKLRASFPFNLVIMLGDNMYGGQSAADYVRKFERPYAALLAAGVTFQASIGNHDRPEQIFYRLYNMNGQRYYTYTRNNVRFFALDSNVMDPKQIEWLEAGLKSAREEWRICYFHHPLYSHAARHGSSVDLRVLLEPLFVRYGVNVVFSGHDHVYERVKPQKGIHYFVSGAAGQLRRGNMTPSEQTAASFDQDQSFMAIEIAGSELFFQAISRTGRVLDSGVITRQPRTN